MRELNSKIGALVKEYRNKTGLTQLELSEKLGYDTPQFVSILERGLAKVPLNVLGKLIVFLGIPERRVTKLLMDAYIEEVQSEIAAGKSKVAIRS